MVNHGDTVGLITPTAWIEFNESGILLNSKKRTTQDLEALKQAKLKIQYADKLIKSNQWVLHK